MSGQATGTRHLTRPSPRPSPGTHRRQRPCARRNTARGPRRPPACPGRGLPRPRPQGPFDTSHPGRLRLGPPRFVVPVAALLRAGSSSAHENGAGVVEVTGSTAVARALDPAVVTAADMVAGHVRLDISCLDRVYLTGF